MENDPTVTRRGSLTVVGTGIGVYGQTTLAALSSIQAAEKVLYLVADPVTERWILELKPGSESLQTFYQVGKDRLTTYLEMTDRILSCVRAGWRVCLVLYGHPGVFVFPSHEAVIRARSEGFEARMLPGVSAEDCLFADLGVDPGREGCQSFEATDFLVYHRKFDLTAALILWQVGMVGQVGYGPIHPEKGLAILCESLADTYGKDHTVVLYEAARYPVCDPIIIGVPLSDAPSTPVSALATMYVPPKHAPEPDLQMIEKLGIRPSYVKTANQTPTAYNSRRPHILDTQHGLGFSHTEQPNGRIPEK